MIIHINKFNHHTSGYDKHRNETITEDQAKRIIEVMKHRPQVMEYYQYKFLFVLEFEIYTLHADLVDFITNCKAEKPNGNTATDTGKKEG